MRSMRALAVAGSAMAVLLAACGGGGDEGISTPTGAIPSLPSLPSGIPTSVPTNLESLLPSGVPSAIAGGTLSQGTARLEVSGGATATADLSTLKTGIFAPGTAMGLTWTDSSGNTLAIGGIAFTGSATTSTTLALSFVITSPELLAAASTAGECTIELSDASAGHVQGTADCQGLQVSGKAVDLHAEFEASR